MTERLNGCTVVFENPIREDDAQEIINAILALKHVVRVDPVTVGTESYLAAAQMHTRLWKRIDEIFREQVQRVPGQF